MLKHVLLTSVDDGKPNQEVEGKNKNVDIERLQSII